MLVHVQTLNTPSEHLSFQLPTEWDQSVHQISKYTVGCAMQMLQPAEFTNVVTDNNCIVTITNKGANAFLITCSSRWGCLQHLCTQQTNVDSDKVHTCMHSLIECMQDNMLPLHRSCVSLSNHMQTTFGYLCYNTAPLRKSARAQSSFYASNATTISKLTDILNNLHVPSNQHRPTLGASYACRFLQLGAIFCATANSDSTSLFHVGQSMMSDMHEPMVTSLYEDMEPEKHHVSILLKGDSVQQRVFRINLAVRIFPPQHAFVQQHLQKTLGLNAGMPDSHVMVLSGVRRNVAAAIYTNLATATAEQHKLAYEAYMQAAC